MRTLSTCVSFLAAFVKTGYHYQLQNVILKPFRKSSGSQQLSIECSWFSSYNKGYSKIDLDIQNQGLKIDNCTSEGYRFRLSFEKCQAVAQQSGQIHSSRSLSLCENTVRYRARNKLSSCQAHVSWPGCDITSVDKPHSNMTCIIIGNSASQSALLLRTKEEVVQFRTTP
jgi:hypothetical protein